MLSSNASDEADCLIIECPSCHSKYNYDEERFDRRPSKKIKCARCQSVFEIQNPAFAADAPPGNDTGESTYASRHPEAKQEPMAEEAPDARPSTGKNEVVAVPQMPGGKRLSLAILDGPDAGSVFRIEKPRVTIGRSNADLTLNDNEASRQHALVEIRDLAYTLSDLGSTNGTLVDGDKIDGVVDLQDKSEFQVGSTTLMLIVTDEQ